MSEEKQFYCDVICTEEKPFELVNKQERMKITKIEYNVYYKLFDTNLIKLNLSVCDKIQIDLTVPIVINEDIDKLNSSSDYYNEKIDKTLLYKSFTDIKNIANINILSFYHELFSKKGLSHNIGFFVLIIL